jgi:Zn-dependent protease with chaperone function
LSFGVAALALVQMSIAVLAAILFCVGVLHVLPLGVMIGLVAGAFYTAEELIRAAIGLSEPAAAAVEGIAVTQDAQPALWRKLHEVAAELGARPPDNLVLGLAPAFFATGGKVSLPDKTVLHGETLYLSVAAMRLLSQRELEAVIGHELSHFAGDDTAFTLRFVPIYQRLYQALAVSHAVQGYGALSALPPRVILREALLSFAKAERRISRAREIAADRAGAAVAGPHALIAAIRRMELCSRQWPTVVQEAIAAINEGSAPENMCERFAALALAPEQWSDESAAIAQPVVSKKARSSDTHPTLAVRAQALGLDRESLPYAPTPDSPAADALLDQRAALEESLAALVRNGLIASGVARPPRDANRPNYLQKKRLQRVRQAESRKRRAAEAAAEQEV